MRIFKLVFILFILILLSFTIFLFNQKTIAQDISTLKICDINSKNIKTFYGTVKPQLSSNLSFQTEGEIVYFPYTKGDYVKKGQIIARLDGILYKIRKKEELARLNEAKIKYDKSKSYYKRMDTLHKAGAISDNDWEESFYQLKTDQEEINIQKEKINYLNKELNFNMIKAPYDGYIQEKYSQIGSYAKIGAPILTIMGSEKTRIEFLADSNNINSLSINQKVNIIKNNKKYSGKIKHISENSFNQSGYIVKIDLDNLVENLKEGMDVEVLITIQEKNIKIPLSSIFENDDEKFVYKIVNIKNSYGEIKKEKITTGQIINDEIEVLSGLNHDDIIICGNFNKIKNNKKVKIK